LSNGIERNLGKPPKKIETQLSYGKNDKLNQEEINLPWTLVEVWPLDLLDRLLKNWWLEHTLRLLPRVLF
jgi:hypothetical protein